MRPPFPLKFSDRHSLQRSPTKTSRMSGSLLQEASCGLREVKNSKHPVSLRHELEKMWEVPFFTENTKDTFCQIHAPNTLGLGTSGRLDDKWAVKVPRTLEPPRAGVAAPRGDVVHGHVCSGRPGAQSGAPEMIPRAPKMQSHHRERGSGRAGPSQGSQGPHRAAWRPHPPWIL